MREIRFRGKYVESGEWVYGYPICEDVIVGPIVEFNDEYFNTEFWYKVDPETVGQYTGLRDKNGKEIYEGDILDGSWINPMTNEMVKKLYEVSYDQGRYLAKLIGYHPYGTTMLYFENKIAEVIGNKWDNPELLEVTEE